MTSDELFDWFPQKPPLYAIDKTYAENVVFGPFFNAPLPERRLPPETAWKDFLGIKLASPIGIAAGPLLTSNWIALAADLGFDLVTYKTIRSNYYPAHTLPNMVYVERRQDNALQLKIPSPDIRELTVTNSFGMPSQSPDFLMEDIPRAQAALKKGQAMIVSVVGTVGTEKSFTEDFVAAACLAKSAGAQLIEANFSCPNVGKNEGCLYMTPEAITEIGTRIVRSVHPIPVIMKMGLFPSPIQMRASILAAARAGFAAIHGINTVSMRITTPQGTSALGKDRPTGGVCGGQIRDEAVQFIQQASLINKEEKLGLALLGVGGAMLPEHFDLFLNSGANMAMTATGMMWDPYLAARYHKKRDLELQKEGNYA